MNDTISREAAIDAIFSEPLYESGMKKRNADAVVPAIYEKIKSLPSEQPEPSTEIQEILDYLDNTLHPIISPDNWNVYSELHDMVSKLPSAQQWIPCSERLPEEDEDVLIAYRYKEGEGDTSHMEIDITSYGNMYFGGNAVHDFDGKRIKHWRQPFAYFTQNYEVVAWMPLPEPWRGEEDEAD